MYSYKRTVFYHETDKMGITHHSNYIKWMEEARVYFLEQFGAPFDQLEAKGIASPVAGLSIDYRKPCTFADHMVVEVEVKSYTGVKLEFEYTIKNETTGDICATGTSRHCFLYGGSIGVMQKVDPELHARFLKYMENK
ncbi:MAG: acyl-CoA thioesterase [Treponema sp.]|nr:acyl-CoA thioesterase [Treponema sp.]